MSVLLTIEPVALSRELGKSRYSISAGMMKSIRNNRTPGRGLSIIKKNCETLKWAKKLQDILLNKLFFITF